MHDFQRETLLAIQDSLVEFMDSSLYVGENGKFQSDGNVIPMGDQAFVGALHLQGKSGRMLAKLRERVESDDIRTSIGAIITLGGNIQTSGQDGVKEAMGVFGDQYRPTSKLLGEALRATY
ncbi:MAG: hypothetical protein JWM34_601 [Ilumatobacteraceae bacterium]|nr:hypothetical protein [Ilumatobacteraceae bacterium]